MTELFDFYKIPQRFSTLFNEAPWKPLFYMENDDVKFHHGGSIYGYYMKDSPISKEVGFHTHNFLEMKVFLDAKNLIEIVENKKFEIKARDILFTNQNEAHRWEISKGYRKRIMFGFSPSFIDETIQDSGSGNYFINYSFLEFFFRRDDSFSGLLNLPEDAFNRVLVQCCQAIHTMNQDCPEKDILVKNHVLSMLSCLLAEYREIIPPMKKNDSRITGIIFYVQNNFKKHITISELSEKFYISKSRLYEIFREGTGTSMSLYMNNIRLQKSKNLLLTTQLNIMQVALDSGFQDISYFNRLFKKKYGTSPQAFRNNHTPIQ